MIDFVDSPPFLRIALRVAMATMHFHIAQTNLFLEELFFAFRVSQDNVAPMKNCPGWVQNRSIRSWGLGYMVILEICGSNKLGYVNFIQNKSTFARPKKMQTLVFILLKDYTK